MVGCERMSDRQELLLGSATGQASRMPFRHYIKKYWILYAMSLPGLLILILFSYVPMYGILIAFKKYTVKAGIFASPWIGLKNFQAFFQDPYAFRIISNTFRLGLYNLIIGFPAPIILALMLNEVRSSKIKRVMQTISYMPHFISAVIVVSIMNDIFATTGGPVNDLLMKLGLIDRPVTFIQSNRWFRTLYIGSGIWAGIGFSSIIYLASMTNLNPELYESAVLDGANRLQQIWHITLPGIRPTITILFIMAVGGIMGNDSQKILLMYSPRNYASADVLSTYVYRMGIEGANFGVSTAAGLFSNLVGLVFLLVTNFISGKLSDTSLL